MILIGLMLLLLGAAACMVLTHYVPTRWLGVAAAVLLLGVAVLLLVQPAADTTTALDMMAELLSVRLDPARRGLAILMLLGSSAALSVLALALSPSLRGFGLLFGWALLTLAAALLGLAGEGLRLPFAWGLTAILAGSTLRATGTTGSAERMPVGTTAGIIASVLLLGYLLLLPATAPQASVQSVLLLLLLVAATVLFMGSAPFLYTRSALVAAPAALVGMLGGVVAPLLALGTLNHLIENLRLIALAPELPLAWRTVLIVAGILALLGGAAGAASEYLLKRAVLWLMVAQTGPVLLTLGLTHPLGSLTVLALLINLVPTTLVAALAAALVEQQTGSEDITRVQPDPPYLRGDLRLAGVLWLVAVASIIGVPGLWGFWGRAWLFTIITAQVAWAVPLVLFSSVLVALAGFVPLIRMFAVSSAAPAPTGQGWTIPLAPVLLALLPLPMLGLFPDLLWQIWLAGLPSMPAQLPISTLAQIASGAGVLALGLILLHLWQPLVTRQIVPDSDMPPAILTPDLLPRQLVALAGLASPQAFANLLWLLVQRLGQAARQMLLLFEGRYYLVGITFALLSILLLMAQGGAP